LVEKLIFLAILSGAMGLYVSQRVPIIITALLTIFALVMTELLSLEQALTGFSNPATITIGAMFVLSGGLIRTGALDQFTNRLAEWSKGSPLRLLVGMSLFIPIASAFINNTPVVVMMVPIALAMSRRVGMSPSKILMPVSFLAIIGGTCTLIGTSTNLLIGEIYRESSNVQLGIFDFLPLGLIFLAVGVVYILLFYRKLLPDRESLSAILPTSHRSNYVTEVIVPEGSALAGKTLRESIGKETPMRLLQLIRGEQMLLGSEANETVLEVDDKLILEASSRALGELISSERVALGTVIQDEVRVPIRTFSLMVVELVVLPESPYIGTRIPNLRLYKRFGVKVMAIQRGGTNHRMDLRAMRVKAGDLLLVQGDEKGIAAVRETGEVLVIEDVNRTLRRRRHAPHALTIMAAVVLLTLITPYPITVWAILGAIAMILMPCLRTEEAIGALDFNVLFLLIGTIPLGTAMVTTGILEDISHFMRNGLGDAAPIVLLSSLFLVTNILTALLSNNAVAVLMTPLAINLASQLQLDAMPFVMAVAFAANSSIATPQGYQTNIIVMGPAGYKFTDFIKMGLPLSLIFWVVATIFIPIIWPFNPS